MDLDVVFLGTAGSAPTAARSASATLIRRGGERLLFDCGEGTQRQLLRSDVGLVDLAEIFLTHYHADHYLGLPGMLKTFSLRGREVPLTIYGPPGLAELVGALRRVFGKLTYELRLTEIDRGDTLERDGYRIEPFGVRHGISGIGYALYEDDRPGEFDAGAADALGVPFGPERGALQRGDAVTLADGRTVQPEDLVGAPRQGRHVVLTGDTAPTETVVEMARGAELLVHEATFCRDEADRARETLHSTAADAAGVARDADVGLLAVTHLSSRYPATVVLDEARAVFPDTVAPRDFDVIRIPFPERGGPEHVHRGARPARDRSSAATDIIDGSPL